MSISLHPDAPQSPTAAVSPAAGAVTEARPSGTKIRSRLFTKYIVLFVAVVGVALLWSGIFEVFFRYREHKAALFRIQHEQAEAAAAKIGRFIKEIESQLGWTTELPWSAGSIEQRRFDALRLLRQVPAITELAQVDAAGKERLRASRPAIEVLDSGLDLSKDPKFTEAVAHKVYYGPVYFRLGSEPSMTLSLAGTGKDAGVSVVEVDLKPIWDAVSQINVGEGGHAYVVDAEGRLIADPDSSLVLRNTDMSKLPQVQAGKAGKAGADSESLQGWKNIQGEEVLAASAPIAPLGWTVFVELPVEEVYASLYPALQRLAVALLGASIFAMLAGIFLARRMVGPIQALRAGAERIGGGDFAQRILIPTGDELEELADQFNDMGARLQQSYADLEKRVLSRTTELSESLQQQTATADVLKVISRSAFDLDSVLATLVASAAKLCEAEKGVIFLREQENYRLVSNHGFSVEFETFAKANPYPMDGGSTTTRAAESSGAVQVVDVLADEKRSALAREYQRLGGYRTNLGVPLRREGETVGVFMLARQVVRSFTPRQIELVETFADQAVIAIENVRLFEEVQERTDDLSEALEQQTATSEVLRVISSSPGELEPVFEAVLANATRICSATFGNLFLQDDGAFREVAMYNVPAAYAETGTGRLISPRPDTALGQVARTRQAAQVEDMRALPSYAARDPQIVAGVELAGIRTVLAVPMLKENEIVGSINIYRQEVRRFSDKQIQLVQNFANQAVIAIENARLLNELRERTRELSHSLDDLRAAQDRLVQTEKLASLGQLTAGIAHEIKNPLNFINNFSALSAELIDELNGVLEPAVLDDKTREEIDELSHMLKGNLEKVVQHGKRADSIVKNMLLHSREGAGEHRFADINAIVEESLNLAYHGARAEQSGFNITLRRDLAPDAGAIDLYPQEITRVLLNLISNGFYAAIKRRETGGEAFEPTLSATTKNLGDRVEIRIRDNGSGIPPEVKEKMFDPFFTTKPAGEGTGLGLSMSHDIVVKQHGGKIEVDTTPGVFTEFVITLPRSAAAEA